MFLATFYVPNFSENLSILISRNGRNIGPSDLDGLTIMKRVDQLKLSRRKIVKSANMRLFYRRHEFYIEVATDGIDITGRQATLGIYTRIPKFSLNYTLDDWLFSLCGEIKEFSNSISRPLQKKNLDVINDNISDIWCANKWNRNIWYIAPIALFAIVPLLIGWLIDYFFNNTYIIFLAACLMAINNCLLVAWVSIGRENADRI